MKIPAALLSLTVLVAPAYAAFERDAMIVLGGGRWGLVEGSGTASDVTDARKCDRTTMSFAFSDTEVQRIVAPNGGPPSGPPDSFADISIEKGVTATTFVFFTAKGDALPAAIYVFDSIAQTLARSDAVPAELYALCTH